MLTAVENSKISGAGFAFAIIASRYNARYVDAMLQSARRQLKKAGAKKIKIIRVPGAFEIPAVASRLAQSLPAYAALICLGVIIRGQTSHARQIGDAVSHSLAQLQVDYALPVINEVLLLENEAQAVVRCLGKKHNRGTEAAQTALEMAQIMAALP